MPSPQLLKAMYAMPCNAMVSKPAVRPSLAMLRCRGYPLGSFPRFMQLKAYRTETPPALYGLRGVTV